MLRRHWFTIASALISLVTIYLLYGWLKSQGDLKLPSGREAVEWMAVGVALYLTSMVVRGLRWKVLLNELGEKPPLRDTVGLVTVGYAANTLLPARAGDAVRVFMMNQRTEAGPSLMVSTLIAERLMDVAVLATAFIVTSLAFTGGLPEGNKAMIAVLLLVLAAIGLIVVRWAIRSDHIPEGVRGILRDGSLAVRQLRGSRHLAQVLGLTILAWTLEGFVYLVCAKAAGVHLTFGEALYVLSTAAMFTMIPSGPGFVGTMDAAISFTMHVLKQPGNLIVPFIFAVRFVIFIPITIIGGLLLITRYGGVAAIKAARAAQSAENKQAEQDAKDHLPLQDIPTGEMAAIRDPSSAEPR